MLIKWTSPLLLLGALRVMFSFLYLFSMNIMSANRIAPDGTPRFAASHLGLFCLIMSHKKDTRLIYALHIVSMISQLFLLNQIMIFYSTL